MGGGKKNHLNTVKMAMEMSQKKAGGGEKGAAIAALAGTEPSTYYRLSKTLEGR